MEKLNYRRDIDGLRAIAVISVILYHLDSNYLPGGFLGVDVFFVLSGYLITKIIAYEIINDKFTFSRFYLRRIRRILPAFYVMVLITLIVTSILYLPSDVINVSRAAFSTLFFASNFYFGRGLDYFAASSDEQPLLHTWSLAVEEQYYFIWPLLLIFLLPRIKRIHLILLMVILSLLSFSFAEILSTSNQFKSLSYYLLPTRFGEMMIGSIVSFLTLREGVINTNLSKGLQILAMSMVIIPMFLVTKEMVFPGYIALWTCFGTALLIFTNPSSTLITRLLSTDVFVFIGKISFSLYLFHWPVFSFFRYVTLDSKLSVNNQLISVIITIILTLIVYKFVEGPCRNSRVSFTKAFLSLYALPSTFVLVLFSYISLNSGFVFSKNDENLTTYDYGIQICHNNESDNCYIGNSKNRVAFLGDSHAAHFAYFLDSYAKENDISFFLRSSSSCPVLPNFSLDHIKNISIRSRCETLRSEFDNIINEFDTVIIAQKWDEYLGENKNLDAMSLDMEALNKKGVKVILIEQIPDYKFDVLRASKFNIDNLEKPDYKIANKNLELIARHFENVSVMSFNNIFNLVENGAFDGQLLYRDSHHLNVYGSKFIAKYVSENKVTFP